MGILTLFVVSGLLLAVWSVTQSPADWQALFEESGDSESTARYPVTSASSDDWWNQPSVDSHMDSDLGHAEPGSSATGGLVVVNAATGLLMVGGMGGVEAAGNAFGSSALDFPDLGSFSTTSHDLFSSSDSFLSMDCPSLSSDSFCSFSGIGSDW